MPAVIVDMRKVPVVRAAFPFVVGLVVHDCFPVSWGLLTLAVAVAVTWVMLAIIFLFFSSTSGFSNTVCGTGIMLFFFLAGCTCFKLSGFSAVSDLDQRHGFVAGWVRDSPVEKERSWLVQIEAVRFDSDSVTYTLRENIQVYLLKDTAVPGFTPGTLWLFMGELKAIQNHGNPGEFDYASYMQRRNYRYNLYCSSARCIVPQPAAKYLPARIRQRILSNWNQDDAGAAVLSAITLGYKSLLDRQTKQSFSDAGAMHLLAVSGLHVGMVWWILDLLLRFPMHSLFWRNLKLFLILAILWFYAGITGLSDSVTRSVTMFSLVALSKTLDRDSNIFNTLLLSGFLLLILKPDRILEPGFQLSYLAVFGIITIQPKCSLLYRSCSKPVKWMLDLVSVSIAAQLGTLPLVLLYFHQFPVWFILTNIAAIPLVSVLLASFVLFSPFLIFFPEYELFPFLLLKLAALLNAVISSISSLPGAVFSDIALHPLVAGSLMVAIVLFTGLLIYQRSVALISLLVALTVTTGISAFVSYKSPEKALFEVYNFNSATIVSDLSGSERNTYIITDDPAIDVYTADYIQSLGRIPGSLRKHTIMQSEVAVSVTSERIFQIREALWVVRAGNLEVLVIGRCNNQDLRRTLEQHDWNVAVFRTGYPRISEELVRLLNETTVIGDGTLREYETESLKKALPAAYMVKHKGAFTLDFSQGAEQLLSHHE